LAAALIFGDPQGILGQQFRPHPVRVLNIINITILNSQINNYF
jgi:hypothetical protein